MEARMAASLDRYITGNYGEDQFKGESDWEELVDETCNSCIFSILNQCPIEYPYDSNCAVVKASMLDHDDALFELEQKIEAQLEQDLADECEFLCHEQNSKTFNYRHVCSASSPGAVDYCRWCKTTNPVLPR